MVFVTAVSGASSSPLLKPITMRATQLSDSDLAFARRKARSIAASVSANEMELSADDLWEQKYDDIVAARHRLAKRVSSVVAARVKSIQTTMQARELEAERIDKEERERLAARLASYERDRLNESRKAQQKAASRARKTSMRAQREVDARLELKQLRNKGSKEEARQLLMQRRAEAEGRVTSRLQERAAAFQSLNALYQTRRQALLQKQQELNRQYEAKLERELQRHQARAVHVEANFEKKADEANRRAELHDMRRSEIARQAHCRSEAELSRRTGSMNLASSASESRLLEEREARRRQAAQQTELRNRAIRKNMEQMQQNETERLSQAESQMVMTMRRTEDMERSKLIANNELQGRKRKALNTMSKLNDLESRIACASPLAKRGLLLQLPGL